MGRAIAAFYGSTVSGLPRPSSSIRAFFSGFWHVMTRDTVRSYRPERHYMRGPGPAWQAKYGNLPGATPQG